MTPSIRKHNNCIKPINRIKGFNSASRTRTYDILINSQALLPTELLRNKTKIYTLYQYNRLTRPFTSIVNAVQPIVHYAD